MIRALSETLQTPGKYSHAVELIAYISALVPLLEPDRLARLFNAINDVDTAFAPAKYTLQLSHRLQWLLERYPEERRERLAYSLWIESHRGRWWDLTAGPNNAVVAVDPEPIDDQVLLELLKEMKLPWNPNTADYFSKMPENEVVREVLYRYNNLLLKGRIVDPDIAVLVSHISWLAPLERPESPVGGLLETIKNIHDELNYEMPKKPQTFSALFPDIKLYGGARFPFPNNILATDGVELTKGVKMELVADATMLADNKTYMGNCTWSYKKNMENGSYVLYRIHDGDNIYNGSMTLNKNTWMLREINSRFNRGNVPKHIQNSFTDFITKIPAFKVDNEILKNIENYKKVEAFKTHKYRYKI